jgi:hypothetical protein
MDKYLVFYGEDYYPSGGWDDFEGFFKTLDGAKKHLLARDPENKWGHIVFEGKIVFEAKGNQKDYSDYYWNYVDKR